MKNFFKKLSFVLALAMVLTSIAPATASAATTNYIAKKGSKKASTVYVFIGGAECDLDYSDASVKGTWKSADKSIAKVDKNGVITPVANGKVKISFVSKDGKTLAKQTVRVCTRAKKLNAYNGDVKVNGATVDMKVGESKDIKVTMPLSAAKIAAGAKKSSYASYCVENTDPSVVTVTKVNDRKYTLVAKAAGESTITIAANQTSEANVLKGTKFVKVDFTVKVAGEFSAKQTGANKITVFGSDLSDKVADYTLLLGTAAKKLETATKQADGSVVLTTSASFISTGDYTLKFGDNSYELACEASRANKIVVDPECAIMTSTHTAIAYFQVLNQYEEDITSKANLTVTASDNDATVTNPNKGIVGFKSNSAFNLNLSQVSLSIAEKDAAVFYSKVLTVSDASRLTTAEIKGVYKSTGKEVKLFEGMTKAELNQCYLLVSGVDQYGVPFDAEKMDSSSISILFSSLTGLKVIVPTTGTAPKTLVLGGVQYAAYQLDLDANFAKLKSGDVTLNGYVLTGGQALNATITVGSGVKIASLKVTPAGNYYGNTVAELNYVAIDTDGNEVTSIDDLYKFNDTEYFKNSKMRFVGSANGKAVLKCDIKSTDVQTMQTLSWITDTLEYGYTTLTVLPDSYPVAVVGVWTNGETANAGNWWTGNGVYLAATSGSTITIKEQDLKYEDQYGNLIPQYLFDSVVSGSGIKVKVEKVNAKGWANVNVHGLAAVNGSNKVLDYTTDDVVKVTETQAVKVSTSKTMSNGSERKSEYTIKVSIVNLDDCSYAAYYLNNNFYAVAATQGAIQATPVVSINYGTLDVRATEGQDYDVTYSDITLLNPLKVGYNKTGEGKATVVINNTAGTTLTADYTTGNADAKTVYATVYSIYQPFAFGTFATKGYATVTSGTAVSASLYLSSSTQYANADVDTNYIGTPRVTYSNLPADTDAYAVTNNGKSSGTITFKKSGYYTIKVTFDWVDGFSYSDIMCFEVK